MSRENCVIDWFDLMQPFALVTYHPDDRPRRSSPLCRCSAV